MNYFNVNSIKGFSIERIKVLKVATLLVLSVVFFYSMTLQSFAAATCTFSPTEDCSIDIALSPTASTVASGGNTDVKATVIGLLQWNAVRILSSDFTGMSEPTPALGGPGDNRVATGNTGAISSRHNVTAMVTNTEGESGSDSIYINITAAPQVNIEFSFLDKFRQFFGSKISESSNLLALEK